MFFYFILSFLYVLESDDAEVAKGFVHINFYLHGFFHSICMTVYVREPVCPLYNSQAAISHRLSQLLWDNQFPLSGS